MRFIKLLDIPFDIKIGKLCFYCYRNSNIWFNYENYTGDKLYGRNRKIRLSLSLCCYSFDFNIYR